MPIKFGQEILLKDITSIVEDIEGVERLEIKKLTYRPNLKQTVGGLEGNYTNSFVEIFPNVSEAEWLIASAGIDVNPTGAVLFNNDDSIGFSYNPSSGLISYATEVDLTPISPGDTFVGGPGEFTEITEITTVADSSVEISKVTTVSSIEGSNEITSLEITDDTNIIGSYVILDDTIETLSFWFNGGGTIEPSTSADRSTQVNIAGISTLSERTSALVGVIDNEANMVVSGLTGVQEVSRTDCKAGSILSSGDHYTLHAANNTRKYVIWYAVDGSGTAPAVSGIRIKVDVLSTDTDDEVATKTETTLNTHNGPKVDFSDDFTFVKTTNRIDYTRTKAGYCTDIANVGALVFSDTLIQGNLTANDFVVTNSLIGSATNATSSLSGAEITINVTNQGIDSNSLAGKYFDIFHKPGVPGNYKYVINGDGTDLSGTQHSIKIQSSFDNTEYVIAFDNGSGPPPTITTETLVTVTFLAPDTSEQIMAKFKTVVENISGNPFVVDILNPANEALIRDRAVVNVPTTPLTEFTPPFGGPANEYTTITSATLNLDNVRVWYDVDNTSAAPAVPVNGRLLEVDINSNDNQDAVAIATTAIMEQDARFSATINTNEVTITDAEVGARTDVSDGTSGFTVEVLEQGSDTNILDNTYFRMFDPDGEFAIFIDVDDTDSITATDINSATGIPLNRIFELNPTTNEDANGVALKLKTLFDNIKSLTDPEEFIVTPVADVGGSLNNKYFLVNGVHPSAGVEGQLFHIWFNVDSTGTDPALSNPDLSSSVGVEVPISSNASVADISIAIDTTVSNTAIIQNTYSASHFAGLYVTFISDNGGTPLYGAVKLVRDGDEPTGFTFTSVENGMDFETSIVDNVVTVTTFEKGDASNPNPATSSFTFNVTQEGADGVNNRFVIRGVDNKNNTLYLDSSQGVDTTAAPGAGGSIIQGSTEEGASTFTTGKCFKRIIGKISNVTVSSVTDNTKDFTVKKGTCTSLTNTQLLDSEQIFKINEFVGDFYFVDAAGNMWDILSNDTNTITTFTNPINNAAVTAVVPGNYNIVTKFTGNKLILNDNIFDIQYNNANTLFSIGAQFSTVGVIGNEFKISIEQSNKVNLGTKIDIVDYDDTTKVAKLNGAPDLTGINPGKFMIDSTKQQFTITAVDNRGTPSISFPDTNRNTSLTLKGSGSQEKLAQGFQVDTTTDYGLIGLYLKREGNITGTLTLSIYDDAGGLPGNLINASHISKTVNVSTLSKTAFEPVEFIFATPLTLTTATQYHMVLDGTSTYDASMQEGVNTFTNSGTVDFTYNSSTGEVAYAETVDLSSVLPGHFFIDIDGDLFEIQTVNNLENKVFLSSGLTVADGSAVTIEDGSIVANDRVLIGVDNNFPGYSQGELSRFNLSNLSWSNSTTGPDMWISGTDYQGPNGIDATFFLSGTKSITLESTLTPVIGQDATISDRYFDDNKEISLIIGHSNGTQQIPDTLNDVNEIAKNSDSEVMDHFLFNTSRFSDDIVNLRFEELPTLDLEDLDILIFGGTN